MGRRRRRCHVNSARRASLQASICLILARLCRPAFSVRGPLITLEQPYRRHDGTAESCHNRTSPALCRRNSGAEISATANQVQKTKKTSRRLNTPYGQEYVGLVG